LSLNERGIDMDSWQVGDKVEAVMGYYKGSRGTITKIEKRLGSVFIFVEFESHTRQFSATPPKTAGSHGHEIQEVE